MLQGDSIWMAASNCLHGNLLSSWVSQVAVESDSFHLGPLDYPGEITSSWGFQHGEAPYQCLLLQTLVEKVTDRISLRSGAALEQGTFPHGFSCLIWLEPWATQQLICWLGCSLLQGYSAARGPCACLISEAKRNVPIFWTCSINVSTLATCWTVINNFGSSFQLSDIC